MSLDQQGVLCFMRIMEGPTESNHGPFFTFSIKRKRIVRIYNTLEYRIIEMLCVTPYKKPNCLLSICFKRMLHCLEPFENYEMIYLIKRTETSIIKYPWYWSIHILLNVDYQLYHNFLNLIPLRTLVSSSSVNSMLFGSALFFV